MTRHATRNTLGRIKPSIYAGITWLACMMVGALASVAMGQDANWDLLNYHLYNGVAFLHSRFDQDLLAAGLQTYLNPLLDASYAGLALGPLKTHPRWLAAIMGLWYGAAIYLAARLAALLHGPGLVAIAGLILAVTGVSVVSQIGTTTNELQAGVVMLGALFILLRRAEIAGPPVWVLCVAGLLFGAAAGLKLTTIVYAPAACLAAASLYRPRHALAICTLFTAAWLAGFAVLDGWWALRLYERFASPVFPMLNGIFRSPWYPPASLVDDRFVPTEILQALFYPLLWLGGQATPSDLPFRDLRAALVLCLAFAALLVTIARRMRRTFERRQRAVLVFLGLGYVSWLATTSILRYAVVLEVLAGLSLPVLLAHLMPRRTLLPVLAGVVAVVLGSTRYPMTGRVPYSRETLQADMGWVEPGTLIVLTFRGPVAHVAGLMPERPGVSVLNVGDTVLDARGWPLYDEVVRRISEHAGPIVVVTRGNPNQPVPELGEVGLDPLLSNCRLIGSTFIATTTRDLHACDGRRRDVRELRSPFWKQASRHYRTIVQTGDPTTALIGAAYLAATGSAGRGTRFIDWTDLLWSGVRKPADPLPSHPDPGTLYVLSPGTAASFSSRLGPADVLGRVDGWLIVAPGWRDCADCTASVSPVTIDQDGAPLSIGSVRRLGPEDRARGVLSSGWWPDDAVAIWSMGEAEMVFQLASSLPARVQLTLDVIVLTGPGLRSQRVVAEVDGHPESSVTRSISATGDVALGIDREWLARQPDGTFLLRLRIHLPDAATPAQLGLSVDPRRLGFSPTTARLDAV